MFKLGLTGSIGMGKSTTAQLFKKHGCGVWDADAAVHRLYAVGGAAVPIFKEEIPGSIEDGMVSRQRLKNLISKNSNILKKIEKIVHPLVYNDRQEFSRSMAADIGIGVFDIPLLFEKGSEREFDSVACVYVDAEIQRQRVMDRGTMTVDQFENILSMQMPIEQKLEKSDFRIMTDTLEHAEAQVLQILAKIKEPSENA